MDRERLEHFLNRYFDQGITPADRGELEQMLRESSTAREAFWESARLHGLLRNWGQGEWGRRAARIPTTPRVLPAPLPARVAPRFPRPVAPKPPPPTRSAWSRWPLAVAALAIAMGVMGWMVRKPRETAGPAPGVAVLTRASSAVWETGPVPSTGQVLPPGTLRLRSGAFQLEFTRGARVVIEGPAEFRLVSDNEGFLQHGKLLAFVPEAARGFLVRTPAFAATDFGTEFGCWVPVAGPMEVHVFAGEVTVRSAVAGQSEKSLHQAEALRVEDGKEEAIPAVRQAFLGEEELAQMDSLNGRDRLAAWKLSSRALAAHPAAVVHLNFEPTNPWERTLKNLARNAPPNSAASVIGCEWTEGRWPGKRALEFKGDGDRLRLMVPGTFRSVTLMAWVRVDSLPNLQNSLLMSESFQPGELHWYIYYGGKIGLGLGGGAQHGWEILQSEPVFRPEMFSAWTFLASVYDGATHSVTHYLNGQPVASGVLNPSTPPVRLDTFEIGNYGIRSDDPRLPARDTRRPGRNLRAFRGRMDEFTILSSPLTAAEIQQFYASGKPGK